MRILKADKNDLAEILSMQKEAYLSEAKIYKDFKIPPLTEDLSNLENEYAQNIFLKAVFEEKIIGSVRGFVENDTCFIGKLIVKTDFQNRGIGKKLMQTIESYFADCQRFELFTGYKSIKNLTLYQNLGYIPFKETFIHENLTLVFLEKMNI